MLHSSRGHGSAIAREHSLQRLALEQPSTPPLAVGPEAAGHHEVPDRGRGAVAAVGGGLGGRQEGRNQGRRWITGRATIGCRGCGGTVAGQGALKWPRVRLHDRADQGACSNWGGPAESLTGAGWYIKYRFFDRPARDREFVVGAVKAGLQFLNEMEAHLTHSLWFDDMCPDAASASSDLQLRHAYIDEAATKYEQVLLEAHARLPQRIAKKLSLPIGRWRLTRMVQSLYDQSYRDGRSPVQQAQWFAVFRKGVWDDLDYQRGCSRRCRADTSVLPRHTTRPAPSQCGDTPRDTRSRLRALGVADEGRAFMLRALRAILVGSATPAASARSGLALGRMCAPKGAVHRLSFPWPRHRCGAGQPSAGAAGENELLWVVS